MNLKKYKSVFIFSCCLSSKFADVQYPQNMNGCRLMVFFAVMGRFKLSDSNGPVHTLKPEGLQSFAWDSEINFSCITKREIRDRSKGDILLKGLVVIQTSWFILQCIACKIKCLPIMELELVTFAFTALNFIMYALWWNKPLDIQY